MFSARKSPIIVTVPFCGVTSRSSYFGHRSCGLLKEHDVTSVALSIIGWPVSGNIPAELHEGRETIREVGEWEGEKSFYEL